MLKVANQETSLVPTRYSSSIVKISHQAKKTTYLRVVAAYRPTKEDPFRIRWTVGGNLIHYAGNTYTPNSDLTTTKILFNSVIATEDAKFMTIDITNFYLNSELDTYEYILIPIKMIPQDIFEEYNLKDKVHN